LSITVPVTVTTFNHKKPALSQRNRTMLQVF